MSAQRLSTLTVETYEYFGMDYGNVRNANEIDSAIYSENIYFEIGLLQ